MFDYSIDLTVSELRSKERKLTRQIEVIKKALSEIGCEDLPNGCDLDTTFDQSNEIQVNVRLLLFCFLFLTPLVSCGNVVRVWGGK